MLAILLQPNPTSGDFTANARQLTLMANEALAKASPLPASSTFGTLLLTPFNALVGTPWLPLSLVEGFFERCDKALEHLGNMLKEIPALTSGEAAMLLSMPSPDHHSQRFFLYHTGKMKEYTCEADGRLHLPGITLYLPEQDFDDAQEHEHGDACGCNHQEEKNSCAASSPTDVDLVVFASPAPFYWQSQEKDEDAAGEFAKNLDLPVLMVNQTGATDGIVFAGQSCAFTSDGALAARAAAFAEDSLMVSVESRSLTLPANTTPLPSPGFEESLFRAATLAVRDYVRKCGLNGAVIGLSGGMDSALVCAIAVEALGPENVHAVLMPSPWSSEHSVNDALTLAKNLGISSQIAPISEMMQAFGRILDPLLAAFPKRTGDLGEENLQARIRGVLLMAFANRLSRAVIGTGNKSEAAVGYCTLYGDTVGAIEPISDIYKTDVYKVARWYNASKARDVIPEHIFTKEPSAELRPGQTDQDSLPPYEILDAILRKILDERQDPTTLALDGVDQATISKVVRLMALAEFKRHQSPPVVVLSDSAFGEEWALPIAAKAWPTMWT